MSQIIQDPAFIAGIQYREKGEFPGAIAAFEAAMGRFPEEAEGPYQLGLTYQMRGERILPPSMRERGAKNGIGDLAASVLGLGVVAASKAIGQTDWILQYREAFRESVTALRAAIQRDPNDPRFHHALALSLRYLGQNEAAAESAHQAALLQPGDAQYQERAAAFEAAATRESERDGGPTGHGKLTWDDVILPQRTKRELKQMQLLLENPSLSRDLGIEPPTGLLLYGPPGTGKTTIARVLAHEAHCHFIATSPAEINSMWLGESEKAVKRIFDEARAKSPAIIFLDEIDALLPSRSGGVNQYSDKVVNQFLHEMDGLVKNKRIFVVGATNRRDMLDAALLRGGRLSREIEIPLPDLESRRALFGLSTTGAKLADDVSLDDLAARTEGYSGANIKAIVNEAGLQALIRLSEAHPETRRILTKEDFDESLTNFTPPPADDETPNPWKMFA
ncbi:MAG: ATP-binding protein [Capsulimonas sp.]|uniref:ATP-binding protein n=1 Tax=Capsulimonas sp. TaxID=2494211 RepID=UPI003262F471